MNECEIISVNIFKPHNSLFKSSRNDKAECTYLKCSNKDKCGLYKRGECALLGGLWGENCIYGSRYKETGWTKNAGRYYSWINERETEHKDILWKLKSPSTVMAIVGGAIYIPYSFVDMNDAVPLEKGSKFLKLECFTNTTILSIINFHPQSWLGGEIKSYQKEQVPKFIKHLSEQFPIICSEICKKSEKVKKILEEYSYVGREAILNTTIPNIGEYIDIHKASWKWDGEYLISYNSKASFMLASKFSEMRIKPEGECVVKITNDEQVNKDTIFKE